MVSRWVVGGQIMRRLIVIAALLTWVAPVLGQTKHPFTFQDLMSLKRVAEPIVSPFRQAEFDIVYGQGTR